MAESLYQESIQLTGLPGATAQSRYVGATVSGYPTSGFFVTGDFIIDQSGTTWVCTSGGSPGTWLNPLNKVTNSVASAYYTSQTAQLGPINLYTAPASGFYQLNYYAKVTSTGTTSTLGPITVTSTDIDGTSITNYGDATSANTVASGFINGMIPLLVGSGTTISYTIPYTSSGSPMGYEAYVNLTSTNLTQNASPVISFNGRTGAVIPGSSDYTAAQVGALDANENVAGKNFVINGGMDIWQRGTTGFTTNSAYTADRWVAGLNSGTFAVSQSTDVPTGFTYSLSLVGTTGLNAQILTRIESANSTAFAGKTVTLSLWAKSTAGTSQLGYSNGYANSVNNFASQTGDTNGTFTSGAPSGSWTKYSATFTPNALAANGYQIIIYRAGTDTSTTLITGVQLEIGSTATAFSRAGGTIQGELAACQRYYYQTALGFLGVGSLSNSSSADFGIRFPVTMRATPTMFSTSISSSLYVQSAAVSTSYSTAGNFYNTSVDTTTPRITVSGYTAGQACIVNSIVSGAYISASAEL